MRRQQGFSYVVVMFLVATLSIISVRALENVLTTERRAKEMELLPAVGQAYRNAIRSYYESSPGSAKTLPLKPEDLLEDQRGTRLRRPLRKLYRDPVTGSGTWGYVYKDDALIGIFSLSPLKPYKRDGFPPELNGFVNAATYQNWRFIYDPATK